MKADFEIPAIMRNLKVDERGYPIPYFVPIVDGKPEFRYQDSKKRDICLKYGKCAVCGNKLHAKSFWFVCGPLGLHNQIHSDAPMHEDCARFSLRVCPHLLFQKAERRSVGGDNPHLIREKPDNIFLVQANKVWTEREDGHVYIKFRPVRYWKYMYLNNKLVLDLSQT